MLDGACGRPWTSPLCLQPAAILGLARCAYSCGLFGRHAAGVVRWLRGRGVAVCSHPPQSYAGADRECLHERCGVGVANRPPCIFYGRPRRSEGPMHGQNDGRGSNSVYITRQAASWRSASWRSASVSTLPHIQDRSLREGGRVDEG